MQLDGKTIEGKGDEPLVGLVEKLFPPRLHRSEYAYLGKGSAMTAGEERKIAHLQYIDENGPTVDDIERELKRVDLVVEYEDLYGKKFVLNSKNERE